MTNHVYSRPLDILSANLRVYSNLYEVPLVHIHPVAALWRKEVPGVVDEHICLAIEVHHYLQYTLGQRTLGKAQGPAATIVIIFSGEEYILPA